MQGRLVLLGPFHLAIIIAIAGIAFALNIYCRRSAQTTRTVCFILGVFLTVNELSWWVFKFAHGWVRFPEGLPLQLCDLALWMTVITAFTLKPWAFDIAYYAALGGSGMAILTPDLWAPLVSYPTLYFFLAHGTVVITVLCLAWSGRAAPRAGSLWRAFAILNIFAVAVGVFDAIFHANYMYLCRKPARPSLLDLLGPWPVYWVGGELVSLVVMFLLWLPYRCLRQDGRTTVQYNVNKHSSL
jgi:hypothetical integral membrane protein (TIGR02206 family)